MSDETPRDDGGGRLCAWCGGPIQQPATGRLRDYCRRSHRQRAYEERQIQERIAMANAATRAITRDEMRGAAVPAPVSSRDDVVPPAHSSRDGSPGPTISSRDGSAVRP